MNTSSSSASYAAMFISITHCPALTKYHHLRILMPVILILNSHCIFTMSQLTQPPLQYILFKQWDIWILCMIQYNVTNISCSLNLFTLIQFSIRMTEANLCSLSTSLMNRSTVFIVWRTLCTIPCAMLARTTNAFIVLTLILNSHCAFSMSPLTQQPLQQLSFQPMRPCMFHLGSQSSSAPCY